MEYTVCQFTDDGEVDYSNESCDWIDGVGAYLSNPFAFELRFLPFEEPKLGKDIHVITCIKDGKYYFYIDWMVEPIEPSSIDGRIYTNNSLKESHLYDLQGRRLQHLPAKGVYIQDGKKRVVK